MRLTFFVGAIALFMPHVAICQEAPPQPLQELFLTEVVYPQQAGEVQVTLSSLVNRAGSSDAALTPFTIEYGVTGRWQVEAEWRGYRQHAAMISPYKTEGLSLGTKYSFMNIAHSHVHAAVGVDAEFHPTTVDATEDEHATELDPFLSLAVDLPRRVTLFGSAGTGVAPGEVADFFRHGERPDQPATISVGGLIALARVTISTEYTDRSDALPWRLDGAPLLTPGVVLHPGSEWELGVGTPIGMRSGHHTVGLAMHLLKEF
jgi:hypothetical protein